MNLKSYLLLLGILLFIASCTSTKPEPPKKDSSHIKTSTRYRVPYDNAEKLPQTDLRPVTSAKRKKLQKLIREIIGSKGTIVVEGKTHNADCSGMVRGIYEAVGVDLMSESEKFPEAKGGVEIIYKTFKQRQWQGKGRMPKAGDLIFFNNTWDKNGNKRWDDPLTHIAMVEGVEEGNNTVTFIHSVSRGIRRYRLNLDHPKSYMHNKRKMNDFLRVRPDSDQDRTKYMSSNLFLSYVDVFEVPTKKKK